MYPLFHLMVCQGYYLHSYLCVNQKKTITASFVSQKWNNVIAMVIVSLGTYPWLEL
jgi:hypothetical protein